MGSNIADMVRVLRERLESLDEERAGVRAELDEILEAAGAPPERSRGRRKATTKRPIREGTIIGWAKLVLQHHGKPWYIDELLKDIQNFSGKTVQKTSLVSSLSRYVRSGEVFTRPKEGYYGLREWADMPAPAER